MKRTRAPTLTNGGSISLKTADADVDRLKDWLRPLPDYDAASRFGKNKSVDPLSAERSTDPVPLPLKREVEQRSTSEQNSDEEQTVCSIGHG